MSESVRTETHDIAGCFYCGEKSTLRCSACWRSGSEITIAYCSKEHQQLMWPIHRLFCREQAHPFRLPPFSRDEADAYIARFAGETQDAHLDSFKKAVAEVFGKERIKLADLKKKLNALIGHGCGVEPASNSKDTPSLNGTVYKLRKSAFSPLEARPTQPSERTALLSHFLHVYEEHTQGCSAPIRPDTIWHSTFCHRLSAVAFGDYLHWKAVNKPLDMINLEVYDPSGFEIWSQVMPVVRNGLVDFLLEGQDQDYSELCRTALTHLRKRMH